mmetsp:Transcript_17335/g.65611  ORF Transcript_17335/g.65611 Transcript_17335/m.65611 type:complete len:268 (-) Transcript_17335:190-993(-)
MAVIAAAERSHWAMHTHSACPDAMLSAIIAAMSSEHEHTRKNWNRCGHPVSRSAFMTERVDSPSRGSGTQRDSRSSTGRASGSRMRRARSSACLLFSLYTRRHTSSGPTGLRKSANTASQPSALRATAANSARPLIRGLATTSWQSAATSRPWCASTEIQRTLVERMEARTSGRAQNTEFQQQTRALRRASRGHLLRKATRAAAHPDTSSSQFVVLNASDTSPGQPIAAETRTGADSSLNSSVSSATGVVRPWMRGMAASSSLTCVP